MLIARKSGKESRVWTRIQATQCLRFGFEKIAEMWKEKDKGSVADMQPDEFASHSGRIGGATALADSFMVHVRANMGDSLWVLTSLIWGSHQGSRKPGQNTKSICKIRRPNGRVVGIRIAVRQNGQPRARLGMFSSGFGE